MDLGIDIPRVLSIFLAMVMALSVHEFAHALAAKLRGDSTAEDMGRLTLNPMAHIDWVGTVFLPLAATILKWPLFGWAKPVPVDPRRFRNPRVDHAIVALAGPLSNILLGFLCAVGAGLYLRYLQDVVPPGSFFYPLFDLLRMLIVLNGILAVFNLIPLPPLDGAAIAQLLLPEEWARRYEEIVGPYGFMVLLVLATTGSLGWVSHMAGQYTAVVSEVAFRLVFMGA